MPLLGVLVGILLAIPNLSPAPDSAEPGRHLIVAVSGKSLSEEQRVLLHAIQPGGVVLLGENIRNEDQTRQLVKSLKKAVSGNLGVADFPLVYVDQEGGRINRLLLADAPSALELGRSEDLQKTRTMGASYARECIARGIGVILAPVLDICLPDASPVIGDRSFGQDADRVSRMGKAFAEGVIQGGALPVAKHFPGHGSAAEDSHLQLAHLNASGTALEDTLKPFKDAAESDIPAMMAGHIACAALDPMHPQLPATLSSAMLQELLRSKWRYNGFVISDDLNMRAIHGDLAAQTVKALRSGCDAVMVCDGDLGHVGKVIAAIRRTAEKDPPFQAQLVASRERLERFRQRLAAVSGQPIAQAVVPKDTVLVSKQEGSARQHTVRTGDTLSGIGKQYGVSVERIQRLNHLEGELIHVGDVLSVSD